MSPRLEMLRAEIGSANTRSFGRVRIAEAWRGNAETVLLHGVGGPEPSAENLVPLGEQVHVVAGCSMRPTGERR